MTADAATGGGGPALGPAEHRVKVKAPKSGSERLELVLDAAPTAANNGVPDGRDDANCTTQNVFDAGPAHYDDPDQLLLYSANSASTCETDNRTGSDKGLSRTWSMASDDHGNLRYVSETEGEGGDKMDEVVYDCGITPKAGRIADDVVNQILSEEQEEPQPQDQSGNKAFQKAVSFDFSHGSDADPAAEAQPGANKLAVNPSEDTSVESVGDRVVTSFKSLEENDQENRPPCASSAATKKRDPPTDACSVLTEPAESGRTSPLKQIKGVLRKPKYGKRKKGTSSTTGSMASNESSRASSLTEVPGGEEGGQRAKSTKKGGAKEEVTSAEGSQEASHRPTKVSVPTKATKAHRKPPARSVSTITRHPSYTEDDPAPEEATAQPPTPETSRTKVQRKPPARSASTVTRHPSYMMEASEASDGSGVAPEHVQPAQADLHQPPQSTFHHRLTLPRDHPSYSADQYGHPHHRPSLPRSPSESSFRSDVARDGYVPPAVHKRGTAEKAAVGLLKTAKRLDKTARRWKRRFFGKGRESRDEYNARRARASDDRHHDPSVQPSLYDVDPRSVQTSLYDVDPRSVQTSLYDVDGHGAPPSPLTRPTTQYSFEGYDHLDPAPPMETFLARGPRGASPAPTPRAAEAAEAAARADGRRSSANDATADANPWAAASSRASDANPWAGMAASPKAPALSPKVASALANLGGQTIPPPNAEPNPFVEPLSPPHGEYQMEGEGMPSVKWWSWRKPDGEAKAGHKEETSYFAFLCAFPGR